MDSQEQELTYGPIPEDKYDGRSSCVPAVCHLGVCHHGELTQEASRLGRAVCRPEMSLGKASQVEAVDERCWDG